MTINKSSVRTGLTILVLFFLVSCSSDETYNSFQSLSNSRWKQGQDLRFEVPINDISAVYQLTLELRHTDEYLFRNFRMLVDCQIPDGGLWYSDTLDVELADRQGKWLGKGLSIYACDIPYRTHVQYPDTGTYVYTIRHGMETDVLKGISDVGMQMKPD